MPRAEAARVRVAAAAAGLLEAPPAAPPAVQRSMTRSVSTSRVKPAELDAPHVAYEMVQGALVRRPLPVTQLQLVREGGTAGAVAGCFTVGSSDRAECCAVWQLRCEHSSQTQSSCCHTAPLCMAAAAS